MNNYDWDKKKTEWIEKSNNYSYRYDHKYPDDIFLEFFYEEFGDNGFDYIQYGKRIKYPGSNIDKYIIDFYLEIDNEKYAIIVKHPSMSDYRSESLNKRKNNVINKNCEEIRQDLINNGYNAYVFDYIPSKYNKFFYMEQLREFIDLPSITHPDYIRKGTYKTNAINEKCSTRTQEFHLTTEFEERQREERKQNKNNLVKIITIIAAILAIITLFGKTGLIIVVSIGIFWFAKFLIFDIYDLPRALTKPSDPDKWPDPKGGNGF